MKTKSKTKKNIQKVSKPKSVWNTNFESHYLAIALVGFLLLEGTLITSIHQADWQRGLSVLDMSQAVSQTVSDVATVFSPVTDAVNNVNTFYSLATTQMAMVLDLSAVNPMSDISFVMDSVNQFYSQAATQMTALLDVSSQTSWPARVAGVSVSQ